MNRDIHQYAGDEVAALDVLPNLATPAVAEATGTDGKPGNNTNVSINATGRSTSSGAKSRMPGALNRAHPQLNFTPELPT